MSAQKFEKLIDLIINEDKEKAEQLFHDIIVEKSREIYESIMDEASEDQSMGLLDEIESEGVGMEGMMEDDLEDDLEIDAMADDEMDDDGMGDMDDGGMDDMDDEDLGDEVEDLEDRVVDLEEKLDELMAEFEAQMGSDDEDMDDMDDMEADEEEEEEGEEEESGLMEDVKLKQVGGTTYNKFGKMGDDGDQTKSPGLQNPKRVETGGKPTNFSGSESVPTSAKRPSNAYAKGDGKLIGDVGNTPGKNNFSAKGESAPKPKSEDPGKSKSPVAESKKTAKQRV